VERSRDQLARPPHDPATLQQVQTRLLKSPELQSLRDSEDRLIQMRDARFANLGEAREHEERAEGLQVAIPLLATLLASTVGVVLAWRTSRTMLRPLNRLNSRIQELRASGKLEARPLEQENLPEEIKALTENFNGLVQRLRDVLSQLEALSLTDPLTQVGNRRRFDHALAAEIGRHRRQDKELALLLLDLDHFKPYNDLYGHPQGDRCLVQLAQALSCLFRRPGELICRIGGEEFEVLLPKTGRQEALRQAQRILIAVEQLAIEHQANPPLSRVSVSVGVSCGKPGDGLTGALLVDAADQARYQGKRDLGRNAVAMADQLDPAGPPNVPRLQNGAARVEATGS
jgi:diguanylate cyclase (GGDEF)-like protein